MAADPSVKWHFALLFFDSLFSLVCMLIWNAVGSLAECAPLLSVFNRNSGKLQMNQAALFLEIGEHDVRLEIAKLIQIPLTV